MKTATKESGKLKNAGPSHPIRGTKTRPGAVITLVRPRRKMSGPKSDKSPQSAESGSELKPKAPDRISHFYVVTELALYRVARHKGPHGQEAAQITILFERNEDTKVVTECRLNKPFGRGTFSGHLISLGFRLRAYVPEAHGFASPLTDRERRIEAVNMQWWREATGPIAAIFRRRDLAKYYFINHNPKPFDKDYAAETLAVLAEIREDDECFTVPCKGSSMHITKEVVKNWSEVDGCGRNGESIMMHASFAATQMRFCLPLKYIGATMYMLPKANKSAPNKSRVMVFCKEDGQNYYGKIYGSTQIEMEPFAKKSCRPMTMTELKRFLAKQKKIAETPYPQPGT